jgi:hypothetical protein
MPVFEPNLIVTIPVLVIASLICSIQNGWGYLEVYIASYLYSFNDTITTGKVHLLFSIMEIGQVIGA